MGDRLGIFEDLSIEEYHKDSAVGSSGLKEFMENPYSYWYNYLNTDPDCEKEAATKYQSFGQHAHIALLEPDKFLKEYKVCEDIKIDNKVVAGWKKFKKICEDEGKIPLLYKEYRRLKMMANEIESNPQIKNLVTGGKAEISFFGHLKELDVRIKGRPDYIKRDSNGIVIIDYKTTDVPLSKHSNQAFTYNQHVQAAIHSMAFTIGVGHEISEVIYIVQSTKPPCLIKILAFQQDDIDLGRQKAMYFLEQMSYCIKNNNWPKPSVEKEYYVRPKWVDYENYPNFINSNLEVIYEY